MLHGVLQHVQHEAAQQILVAAKRDVERPVRADRDAALGGQHVDGAAAVGDQFVEIQIHRAHGVAAGIRAREHEHVLDQTPEPPRLAADDPDRFAVLGLLAVFATQHHVGGRAHDGNRRPQLVRRVGHELPLRLQRRAHPRDEAVERRRELAEFVGPVHLAQILEAGRRDPSRAPRHVGDRAQADRREPEPAPGGQQQRNRDPDEHRLLHFPLLAKHVGHRTAGQQHERQRAERVPKPVYPPRAGRGLDGPDVRQRVAARQGLAQLEPVPARSQHRPALVENRQRAARRIHGAGRLDRGGQGSVLLVQLILHDIGERRQEPAELAIDAADADPPLLPQHGGAEQDQHDEQRQACTRS